MCLSACLFEACLLVFVIVCVNVRLIGCVSVIVCWSACLIGCVCVLVIV